jgi:hypothetical protein
MSLENSLADITCRRTKVKTCMWFNIYLHTNESGLRKVIKYLYVLTASARALIISMHPVVVQIKVNTMF